MAYNSDGYIMIDFTEVDFRRTNQTIEGLYKRCVDVIGTNKFILVINANGRTPLPATCSFTNNQYVIDTCIYMFAISSNDNLFIRRNDVPASDIIDDDSVSVDKTWSSNKINTELSGKQDTLTAGTNITIDENNVISSTGGAVIDDNVIVNNKVWSSLNIVEKLAPIDTIIGNPATFNTSLELPVLEGSISFSATQEGSGDPSPSNVRNIVGVDDITLSINGNSVVIDLDGTRYGGYVDLVNKKAYITYVNRVFDGSENWSYTSQYASYYIPNMKDSDYDQQSKANWLKTISSIWQKGIGFGASGNRVIYITQYVMEDIGVSDLTGWKNYLNEHNLEITYPIRNPLEISLSDIPTLSTIIGNNSFASDTGSIKVSYKCLPSDLL